MNKLQFTKFKMVIIQQKKIKKNVKMINSWIIKMQFIDRYIMYSFPRCLNHYISLNSNNEKKQIQIQVKCKAYTFYF